MSSPQPAMTKEELQRRALAGHAFKQVQYMDSIQAGTQGGQQAQFINPQELQMPGPATVDTQPLQRSQSHTPGARHMQNQPPQMSSPYAPQQMTPNGNPGARQIRNQQPQMSSSHALHQKNRNVTPGAHQARNQQPQMSPYTQQQIARSLTSGAPQAQNQPSQMSPSYALQPMTRNAIPGARQVQWRPPQASPPNAPQQMVPNVTPGVPQMSNRAPQMSPHAQQQMMAQYGASGGRQMQNRSAQMPPYAPQQMARTVGPGVQQTQMTPPHIPQQDNGFAYLGVHQSRNLSQPRAQHLQQPQQPQRAQYLASGARPASMPPPPSPRPQQRTTSTTPGARPSPTPLRSPTSQPMRYLTRAQYRAEVTQLCLDLKIRRNDRGGLVKQAKNGQWYGVYFNENTHQFVVVVDGEPVPLPGLRGEMKIVEEGDPRAGRAVASSATPGGRPMEHPGANVTGNIAAAVRQSAPTPAPDTNVATQIPANSTPGPRNPTPVNRPMPPPQWAPTTTASSSRSPPSEPSPGSRKRNAEGQLKNSPLRSQQERQQQPQLQPQRVAPSRGIGPHTTEPPAAAPGPAPAPAPVPVPSATQASPRPLPAPPSRHRPSPRATLETPEALRKRQVLSTFRSLPIDEQRLVAACTSEVIRDTPYADRPYDYLYDRWFGPAADLIENGLSSQNQASMWREDGTHVLPGENKFQDRADIRQVKNEPQMATPDELEMSVVRIQTPPPLDFGVIDAAIEELGCWAELGVLVGGMLDEVWSVCQSQD